jgi:hypothetical protein
MRKENIGRGEMKVRRRGTGGEGWGSGEERLKGWDKRNSRRGEEVRIE